MYNKLNQIIKHEFDFSIPRWFDFIDNKLNSIHRAFSKNLRIEYWVVYIIGLLIPCWIAFDGFGINTDAYYHAGIARLYSQGDFLYDGFRWLPYTVLAESPFPQVYFLQHLVTAPLHWFFSPLDALFASSMFTAAMFTGSVMLVFKRWEINGGIFWGAFGWLMGPLLIFYVVSFKGASIFFPLLVWILDAHVRQRRLQLLILCWLAAYSYPGSFTVLTVIAGGFVGGALLAEKRWVHWHLTLTILGLACGFLLNPYFPSNLCHMYAEMTVLTEQFFQVNWPEFKGKVLLEPGNWIGTEWKTPTTKLLLETGGGMLATAVLIFILATVVRNRLAVSAVLVVSAFLMGLILVGPKMLALLSVVVLMFFPLILDKFAAGRKWVIPASVIWMACWIFTHGQHLIFYRTDAWQTTKNYQQLAEIIATKSSQGSLVLTPWDKFPMMFYFNQNNNYLAGMNIGFLDLNGKPFKTLYHVYEGNLNDPEVAIKNILPDTELILFGKKHTKATKILDGRPEHFSKIDLPANLQDWHLFKLIK